MRLKTSLIELPTKIDTNGWTSDENCSIRGFGGGGRGERGEEISIYKGVQPVVRYSGISLTGRYD